MNKSKPYVLKYAQSVPECSGTLFAIFGNSGVKLPSLSCVLLDTQAVDGGGARFASAVRVFAHAALLENVPPSLSRRRAVHVWHRSLPGYHGGVYKHEDIRCPRPSPCPRKTAAVRPLLTRVARKRARPATTAVDHICCDPPECRYWPTVVVVGTTSDSHSPSKKTLSASSRVHLKCTHQIASASNCFAFRDDVLEP